MACIPQKEADAKNDTSSKTTEKLMTFKSDIEGVDITNSAVRASALLTHSHHLCFS